MNDSWHWQEPGTAWRGVGIYHVTLTVTDRQPLLGELIIPDNDPKQAYVKASHLGIALLECLKSIPTFHPEIQVLQYCLMPDHLHAIWYVRQTMNVGIRYVAQGFERAAKRIGRAYSYTRLSGGTTNERYIACDEENLLSSIVSAGSREDPLRQILGGEAYGQIPSLFTERPFIRPMSRKGQLQTMIRYVQLNPQRLATKRLKPEYFYVQEGVEINGRIYSAVGNSKILMEAQRSPVHVRHTMVDEAQHGDDKRLRDYMDSCLNAAQNGAVMVSPFINQYEREVLDHLIQDKRPVIYIADNGFRDYYKPSAHLFNAVDAGIMLILSPWEYDPMQKHVSRAKCVEMNNIAEEICRI